MCFSCICLFIFHVLFLSVFSSSWCRGLASVCDHGTPWAFLLTCFLLVHLFVYFEHVDFCLFSLPFSVMSRLWLVIVALPGRFN